MVYAAALPLGVLVLWAGLLRPGWHKSHVTILGLFISVMLTAFLTDVVKNAVGRPRPDLLARCKPRAGTPQNKLVTIDVCTETDHHILHDGWRSFPSGHSSFAFSGLGYLAMYVPHISQHLHTLRAGAEPLTISPQLLCWPAPLSPSSKRPCARTPRAAPAHRRRPDSHLPLRRLPARRLGRYDGLAPRPGRRPSHVPQILPEPTCATLRRAVPRPQRHGVGWRAGEAEG